MMTTMPALPHLDTLLWASRRADRPSAWHGHVSFAHWLVNVMKPRLIVELGTENGVSYAAMCHAVAASGLDTRCFAIDTWAGDAHTGAYSDDTYNNLRGFNDAFYSNFSTLLRCTFDDALPQFAPASIDILHVDGLHTYDAVRHDFETWLPKVSQSGVILFHDITIRTGDFGVWKLWEELQRRYPTFSFQHSAGLGVVLAGTGQPQALVDLCQTKNVDDIAHLQRAFEIFSNAAFVAGRKDEELRNLSAEVAGIKIALQQSAATLIALSS